MDAVQPSLTSLLEELQVILAANKLYLDHPARTAKAETEYKRGIERLGRVRAELKTLQQPDPWKPWPT